MSNHARRCSNGATSSRRSLPVRWAGICAFPSPTATSRNLTERGLSADHTTIWRWVQRYAPELHKRCRRELKPTNGSWRVDETYIRVKGTWAYLYHAVDSCGASIDFLLSAHRDAAAAKRFFQRALQTPSSQGFRSFQGARRTIEGYETVHMIRKGQVRQARRHIQRQSADCSTARQHLLDAGGSGRIVLRDPPAPARARFRLLPGRLAWLVRDCLAASGFSPTGAVGAGLRLRRSFPSTGIVAGAGLWGRLQAFCREADRRAITAFLHGLRSRRS